MAGRAIATAVSVASGCLTKQFAHYFPTDTHDIDWLPHIGRWGWILLTKDWDIQDNVTERTAMLNAGVRAFVLRDERLPRDVIIEVLRFNLPRMLRMIARYQAPFIVAIESQAGGLTPLSELTDIDPSQK